jgi:hypothetical protein
LPPGQKGRDDHWLIKYNKTIMAAANYNITIEQGADFSLPLTWKDGTGAVVNVTGYSARMQIRESYDSDDYIISLTSGVGGGITLGGAAGTINIEISSSVTANMGLMRAVYDLELVSLSGIVTRLVQGDVTISREVTR